MAVNGTPLGKRIACKEHLFLFRFPLAGKMEESQRKKASRKAYRSHLTHLFRKVDAILDPETRPTETQIATLTSSIEQLTERGTLLRELDAQIAATIETENEIVVQIIESEATREAILDTISQIKRRIDSLHTSPTTPAPSECVYHGIQCAK